MQDTRAGGDGDFHGFVGARWPSLVRTLVLIGCPVDLAPEVVATGLSRCRRHWREAVLHDDLDVVVHREVLSAWEERRRGTWWTALQPGSEDDWPAPDLSALDRVTPEVRAGLVLSRFAALDRAQVVAVAGRAAGGPLPDRPDATTLRAAGESVLVTAPDPEDLVVDGAPWWRRRWVVAVAGALTIAVVLGGGTWWANRDAEVDRNEQQPVGLSAVEPKRSPNPAGVAWYADDVLHLANATYVLPTLRDLALLSPGAVYGDVDGRVVYLADDGTRTLLGTKDPMVPLVASDSLGWVAWVDPAGLNPRLLVYDIGQADIIAELDLPASRSGAREQPAAPIAIDQQRIYYVSSEGARAWAPTRDPDFMEAIEPPGLRDVASANRVFQIDDDQVLLDQPFMDDDLIVPGVGGGLSEDGEFMFTRDPADGTPLVYDVDSGELLDVRPPEQLGVVDVVLAPAGAITYLVIDPDGFATQDGNDSTPIQGRLATCRLDDGSCEILASFVLDSEAPILAR